MSDLVERLRQGAENVYMVIGIGRENADTAAALFNESRERIEQLEAALRDAEYNASFVESPEGRHPLADVGALRGCLLTVLHNVRVVLTVPRKP